MMCDTPALAVHGMCLRCMLTRFEPAAWSVAAVLAPSVLRHSLLAAGQ